jgi:cell wall-associated NlpC family hydrolase
MTLAISSAIPNNLIRYSHTGLNINDELISEARHLANVLNHFEVTCREAGYALNVSYLAIKLQNYGIEANNLDRAVGEIGRLFWLSDFILDSVKWTIKGAEVATNAIIAISIKYSPRYLYISLEWVKIFGLKPQGVRIFFGITARRIRIENFIKYCNKIIGKATILLAIGLEWVKDFRDYSGTKLISALLADAIFIIVAISIVKHIALVLWAALAGNPVIIAAFLCFAAVILLSLLMDWIWENFLRDWSINMLETAIKWTMTGLNLLLELGAKTVQALDEKIFGLVARAISLVFNNPTNFVDSASKRLQKQMKDNKTFEYQSEKMPKIHEINYQKDILTTLDLEQPPKLNKKLEDVINELNVENNERYRINRQGRNETYCNIYVMDVAKELGIKLFGEAAKYGSPEAVDWDNDGKVDDYMDANKTIDWLRGTYKKYNTDIYGQGPENGWKKVSSTEAAILASKGYFVLVCWYNTNGIGHIAIVRPNSKPGEIHIAQAGKENFSDDLIDKPEWPLDELEYFVYTGDIRQKTNP